MAESLFRGHGLISLQLMLWRISRHTLLLSAMRLILGLRLLHQCLLLEGLQGFHFQAGQSPGVLHESQWRSMVSWELELAGELTNLLPHAELANKICL